MRPGGTLFALFVATLTSLIGAQGSGTVTVGSKNFTESGVLGELMAQVIEEHTDLAVERSLDLGGTQLCWTALVSGQIDLYAEYTGTGWAVILKEPHKITDSLQAFLHVRQRCRQEHDIDWLQPFGLNNSYALAMTEAKAEALGVRSISDLRAHAGDLRAGFSIEFMERADGFPGLVSAYRLELEHVRALEHGLAYAGVGSGEIDLIDAYTTDSKLLSYRLRVLEDDRSFFPPYTAAPLVRRAALREHPQLEAALGQLAFRVPDRVMQRLNHLVEAEGHRFADVARAFLEIEGLASGRNEHAAAARASLEIALAADSAGNQADTTSSARPGFFERVTRRSSEILVLVLQHIALTLAAVLLAAFIAIPLGIAIATPRRKRLRQVALTAAGVVQTIPSLALLAFMVPLLGLGFGTAIAALFLYAILPILRNTYTGIVEVDADLLEAARGMGMRSREILTRVQLPLAVRTIMAGLRTATVIGIGMTTLAAFVGAGGLGKPIVQGLYLVDTGLILTGAVPAALLTVLADVALGRLERALEPRTQSTKVRSSSSS